MKDENLQDTIFEWIPYNKFADMKRIRKVFTITIWKDGPLKYSESSNEYKRDLNKKVVLKFLNSSQNISDEFLNKV